MLNPTTNPQTVSPIDPWPRRSTRPQQVNQGGKAKMLTEEQLNKVLAYIDRRRESPEADKVKILLSFMAGLRACEIAGLRMRDVTDAYGRTGETIQIRAGATKGGRARVVPICPELKQALEDFRQKYPGADWLAISHRNNSIKRQSVNAVTVWFRWLYQQCGLQQCSSHSGRRTFITLLARNLGEGQSLKDVQTVVGHVRLNTTEAYIECSSNVRGLVNNIGSLLRRRGGAE